jgi:ComF family protein
VDRCLAVLAYEDEGRELVARLKYRNARSPLRWLTASMAALAPAGPAVVTWVPTTTRRRRDRGFDQAELLARGVARHLGAPCRPLLRRAPGLPQTGKSLVERLAGPRLAAARAVAGRVILVDDVVTSGATVTAAAAVLRRAGAAEVIVVAAARTPPHAQAGVGRGRQKG